MVQRNAEAWMLVNFEKFNLDNPPRNRGYPLHLWQTERSLCLAGCGRVTVLKRSWGGRERVAVAHNQW